RTSAAGIAAYCPVPTALHFRAIWKRYDVPATERMHEIARSAPWWPLACKLAIPPGVTEQSEFFAAMAPDPSGWADRVRAGVGDIADRLAWASLLSTAQTWPPLR
ncbi:MAG TPA: hypothetical protein VLA85_03895, partial [Verrucomicrobiae bacterium]|nr:hypothetical protein [Verrucomicrobiae bacterium]